MREVAAPRGRPAGATRIREVYRRTRKSRDVPFNVYVARPLAAVIVYLLRDTRVSPNQVTFFSLLLTGVAAALVLLLPWPVGLWLGVATVELSYVFDKVDGMLARLRGVDSASGHLLDFLMDEVKATLTLAAVCVGAFRQDSGAQWLLWGLGGVVALSAGVSITTFQRRPEVVGAAGQPGGLAGCDEAPPGAGGRGSFASVVALLERLGRFCVHYPSYIWLSAVLVDVRWYVYPYAVANALYAGRSLLGLALRYARFAPRPLSSSGPSSVRVANPGVAADPTKRP